MRATKLTKILDAVALSVASGKTNIKYTEPIDISNHDFNVDVNFIVVNSGNSTNLDIHHQYGFHTLDFAFDIEAKVFSGSGLNDMTTSGTYSSKIRRKYKVEIDGTGGTDTYKWSNDDGATFKQSTVPMVSGAVELEYGVNITFAAQTGHTSGDFWYFDATDIIWVANSVKTIDAMSCAGSQKYESETLVPTKWIRFWVDNQDTNTATVTVYLIIQTAN